jgi:hypothetical protein
MAFVLPMFLEFRDCHHSTLTVTTALGHPGRGLVTTLLQFRNHFPRDTILPF